MKHIADYKDPFHAVLEFEKSLADFTGSPYCITTDSCTHAMEISFRLINHSGPVSFPAKTYLSVLMTMHKVGVKYYLKDIDWKDYYIFEGSKIWDCARYLKKNMYQPGTLQCLSFGRTKPLAIGQGGCILTDDKDFYIRASRMRYDGRDIFSFAPWNLQKEFQEKVDYLMNLYYLVYLFLNRLMNLNYLMIGKKLLLHMMLLH